MMPNLGPMAPKTDSQRYALLLGAAIGMSKVVPVEVVTILRRCRDDEDVSRNEMLLALSILRVHLKKTPVGVEYLDSMMREFMPASDMGLLEREPDVTQ